MNALKTGLILLLFAIFPLHILSGNKNSNISDDRLTGNYYIIQPGLFNIYKELPYDIGHPLTISESETAWTNLVFPLIFSVDNKRLNNHHNDTLKYNWHNATIICKNTGSMVDFIHTCTLISSIDSIYVYDIFPVTKTQLSLKNLITQTLT